MIPTKCVFVCLILGVLIFDVELKKCKKKECKKSKNKDPKVSVDPFCSMSVDCNDITNRKMVDGIEFRTSSGKCNNLDNFSWGNAGVQQIRLVPNAYSNGKWGPRQFSVAGLEKKKGQKGKGSKKGRERIPLPTSRSISNAVHATLSVKPDNDVSASLALFYFMQFIDHDITNTPKGTVGKNVNCCSDQGGFCLPIIIQASDNDDFFEVGHCMQSRRSKTVFPCNDDSGFQNQFNEITSFIDGSGVYGSSDEKEMELRSMVAGFLKTSTAEFMPESKEDPIDIECNTTAPGFCFDTGDKRSNIHPSQTSFHTVFLREHNRIAAILGSKHSNWTDERIFQETRSIVEAELQHITYNEMMPAMLSSEIMAKYGLSDAFSYNPGVDASIIQSFTIAFRFHNLMPANFHFAEESNSGATTTHIKGQEDVFHDPSYVFHNRYQGVDQISLGFAANKCPYVNRMMNDASRNKFFGKVDLAALDIERGREWGTPSYARFRSYCGLGDATEWSDLLSTHLQDDIDKLKSVYEDPRDIDLWTGVVSEKIIGTSLSGATQSCLLGEQFANIRNGDRFWYEGRFSKDQLTEIRKVTMGKILCDNLDVTKMPGMIFNTTSTWLNCGSFPELNLNLW